MTDSTDSTLSRKRTKVPVVRMESGAEMKHKTRCRANANRRFRG